MSGETFHATVGNRDEIATHRPIIGAEFDSLRRRLQRRSARVIDQRIVPEQTHRPHIAAGGQFIGNCDGTSDETLLGNRIHVRGFGEFQRSDAAQRGLRFISTSIGDD